MTIKSKLLALIGMAEAMSEKAVVDTPVYDSETVHPPARSKPRRLKRKKKFENKARATQARINKTWK